MGPFFLVDLLGLDTVLHVAEHLDEQLGDRFYVHKGMQRLVADKQLGAKTGGAGFYKDGEPQIEGDADAAGRAARPAWRSRPFVEACLVLEEGVASTRAIDLGMMAGAGMDPRRGILPPLMAADIEGLDTVLEKLERAEERARRALRAAGDPPAPRRAGPPRPEDRPGLLPVAAARRGLRRRARSSSRRATTTRSRG